MVRTLPQTSLPCVLPIETYLVLNYVAPLSSHPGSIDASASNSAMSSDSGMHSGSTSMLSSDSSSMMPSGSVNYTSAFMTYNASGSDVFNASASMVSSGVETATCSTSVDVIVAPLLTCLAQATSPCDCSPVAFNSVVPTLRECYLVFRVSTVTRVNLTRKK